MRVVILAAGSQSRWLEAGGEGFKQLATVGGEALIHRTFRLASEHCSDVVTVVRDPGDRVWAGLNAVAPRYEDWMGEQGKVLQCVHLWPKSGEVVTLLGDVYYSERSVERIFHKEPVPEPMMYGHSGSGVRGEIFGFRFDVGRDGDRVKEIARKATGIKHTKGGLWRWFYVNVTGSLGYGKEQLARLASESSGWVELPHDETDDFDHPSYLKTWARRFGRQFGKEIMSGKIATTRMYGVDRFGREVLVAAPGQRVPAGFREVAPKVDFQERPAEPVVDVSDELARLTVKQLRELAGARGLSVTGLNKAGLVEVLAADGR